MYFEKQKFAFVLFILFIFAKDYMGLHSCNCFWLIFVSTWPIDSTTVSKKQKKKKQSSTNSFFFSVCEMLTSAVIKYETRTMHTGIITRPPISMMTSAAVVKKKKDLHGRPVCKKKK